jgi:Transposase, Mutator family
VVAQIRDSHFVHAFNVIGETTGKQAADDSAGAGTPHAGHPSDEEAVPELADLRPNRDSNGGATADPKIGESRGRREPGRRADLTGTRGSQHGAVIGLWRSAWEEFTLFLACDPEIRTMLCGTNAIESLNARYRRAVGARGHFPAGQAALKCLHLVIRSLNPQGKAR